MIDTLHLLPPDLGPRSNPVLYGIAEAIAELLPLETLGPRPAEDGYAVESVEAPTEAAKAG